MDGLTASLTAVAALAAALFSGVSFFLGERREAAKWKRDALLQTYEDYLNLSRARDHVADQLAKSLASGDVQSTKGLYDSEAAFHEKQLDALTRLRLLATQEVISAAEALHVADHRLLEAAEHMTRGGDLDSYSQVSRADNKQAKARLFDAIRRSLGLPADTRIHPDM